MLLMGSMYLFHMSSSHSREGPFQPDRALAPAPPSLTHLSSPPATLLSRWAFPFAGWHSHSPPSGEILLSVDPIQGYYNTFFEVFSAKFFWIPISLGSDSII